MLLDRVPELELAVSATTRARRPSEEEGREYYFMSREDFDRRLAADEFLEWVEWPWGEHKRAGTLWSELERITEEGRPVLLELETGGALAVRDRIPGSVTIFITAPNREELERRLRARGPREMSALHGDAVPRFPPQVKYRFDQKRQAWISGASGVLWMRRLPRGSNLKCFTALVT